MNENNEANNKQPTLTRPLVWLMSIASGISVANIYYIQPLLAQIALDYHVSQANAGLMATLTQMGYALGILLILPLADIVEKRRLISTMPLLSCASLAWLYGSPNFTLAAIASCAVGFTGILPLLLIPFGAQLAKPHERGKVIGSILSGLLVGILLSRVLSGFVGEYYGWKMIYLLAANLMLGLGIVLRFSLPKYQALSTLSYQEALLSMFPLIRRFPVLREASLLNAMSFCAFTAFWTALVFLLKGPHYHLGAAAAGLFGLVGVVGVVVSPLAGTLADSKGPRFIVGLSIMVIIAAYLVFSLLGYALAGLIAGVILLDLGAQCGNVSNQARINQLNEEARSRVTAIYAVASFLGGAVGSYAGAWSFEHYDWLGVCVLGLMTQVVAGGYYWYGRKAQA